MTLQRLGPAMRLLSTTITVADLDRALPWYRDHLDVDVVETQQVPLEQPIRYATLQQRGQDLAVVVSEPLPMPDGTTPEPGSSSMIAFAVDDCQAAFDRLVADGAQAVAEPMAMPGQVAAILRDPDGNPFSLVQRVRPVAGR